MTTFNVTTAIVGLALLTGATAAAAQDTRTGRYTMHKTDDGFVRLDTETGAISMCRKTSDGWGCEAMNDPKPSTGPRRDGPNYNGPSYRGPNYQSGPPSYSGPNDLASQNAELKAEIQRLEELLELRGKRKAPSSSKQFKLPTEGEVDQALDYFEKMLKKFQDRLKRLEKSEPKSDPKPGRQL